VLFYNYTTGNQCKKIRVKTVSQKKLSCGVVMGFRLIERLYVNGNFLALIGKPAD
jgi:uncharacterized protein YaiL (DUF2058 family)